jgi:hypothetical protein
MGDEHTVQCSPKHNAAWLSMWMPHNICATVGFLAVKNRLEFWEAHNRMQAIDIMSQLAHGKVGHLLDTLTLLSLSKLV